MDHLGSGVRDETDQHRETPLNLGGRGCGKLIPCHCTPAWAKRAKLGLKKKINILQMSEDNGKCCQAQDFDAVI